jgi:hypothetical protein
MLLEYIFMIVMWVIADGLFFKEMHNEVTEFNACS